jgi:uncharacterized membrane protein
MLYPPTIERPDSMRRFVFAADAQPRPPQPRRLPAIDASRGAAMVLVCLAHFSTKYIFPAGGDAPGTWLPFLSHVASPMFFVISGAMVGYLAAMRPERFDRVRATLARRALFFLSIGHVLILGAHIRHLADVMGSGKMLFVTDTIAIALLLSPRLLRIPARWRLAGAVCAYAFGCALVYMWEPHSFGVRIFKDTLLGIDGDGYWEYNVPMLPWLAVHAAGTVLGALLADTVAGRSRVRIEARLAIVGSGVLAAAAMVRVVSTVLLRLVITPGGRGAFVVRQLATPWQREPPSPAHLLLFSGLALLAMSAIFYIERVGIAAPVIAWLCVLGRTSAFVFILQFYVFYVAIPDVLPIKLVLAPFIFVVAMALIGECARRWLNRRWRFARPAWFLGATAITPASDG